MARASAGVSFFSCTTSAMTRVRRISVIGDGLLVRSSITGRLLPIGALRGADLIERRRKQPFKLLQVLKSQCLKRRAIDQLPDVAGTHFRARFDAVKVRANRLVPFCQRGHSAVIPLR